MARLEQSDIAASQPAKVKELLQRFKRALGMEATMERAYEVAVDKHGYLFPVRVTAAAAARFRPAFTPAMTPAEALAPIAAQIAELQARPPSLRTAVAHLSPGCPLCPTPSG